MSVRLLVTGARGQLGSEVVAAAQRAGLPVAAFGSADLDITNSTAVRRALKEFAHSQADRSGHPGPESFLDGRPTVINTAAYTAVDAAESDRERAFAVNATGPGLLAGVAAELGLGLIHVSTDYVFPGTADRPYEVDDETGPVSVYGQSKLAGELAVAAALPEAHVVRTAWVYGAGGQNFVKTMAALERTRETVSVVRDQVGSPTWAADLAAGLLDLAALGDRIPGGVLHACNAGSTSWYGFARAVFDELGADPNRVLPVTSDQFVRPAPRPAYSVLSSRSWTAAGLAALRPWEVALAEACSLQHDQLLGTG